MDGLRTALEAMLDHVDYTSGACGVTEMVGAVLPRELIVLAREALKNSRKTSVVSG